MVSNSLEFLSRWLSTAVSRGKIGPGQHILKQIAFPRGFWAKQHMRQCQLLTICTTSFHLYLPSLFHLYCLLITLWLSMSDVIHEHSWLVHLQSESFYISNSLTTSRVKLETNKCVFFFFFSFFLLMWLKAAVSSRTNDIFFCVFMNCLGSGVSSTLTCYSDQHLWLVKLYEAIHT